MFVEFGLEALEQGKGICSRAGKSGQHTIIVKATNLAGGRLDHHAAERDLAIATQSDAASRRTERMVVP